VGTPVTINPTMQTIPTMQTSAVTPVTVIWNGWVSLGCGD
jgi:hypothetical protein